MPSEYLVLNEDGDFSFDPRWLQMTKLAERIERVKETIASACARSRREVEDVRLVIVTKSAGIEEIEEVVRLGFDHLGETRVQLKKVGPGANSSAKQPMTHDAEDVLWHMIGHLQRNKVRRC
jgi:uncharacterized pyridoxal phosphate-containing UPF0001 family protein